MAKQILAIEIVMSNIKLFEIPREDPSTPLFQRESVNRDSSSRDSGKKLLTRSRVLIIVAFILLVTVVLTVILAVSISSNEDEGNDCTIQGACNSKVLAYIDTRFDPCEDFFNYSCGKWLSANPLGDHDELDMFYEVTIKNLNNVERYLSRSVSGRDSEAIKKSKYMFSACTDTTYIQNNLNSHITSFMTTAGGWKDIGILPGDEWDFYNLTDDHYLGSPAYFAFDLEPDDLDSSKLVIKVNALVGTHSN